MNKKFFQTDTSIIVISILSIFILICGIVYALVLFSTNEIIGSIILILLTAILLFFLFALFRFFLQKVVVDEEKIVVKGIFGIQTQCIIKEIQKVYDKEFFKEGRYYVLIDGRELKTPHSFTQKNSYVRFKYNSKTEKILKTFWKGSIEVLDYKQDLPLEK